MIVQEALASLAANKLRSALSVLGVIIGISSVTLLLGVGNGFKQTLLHQLDSLGNNLIFVSEGSDDPWKSKTVRAINLSRDDVEQFSKLPGIEYAVPVSQVRASVAVPAGSFSADIYATTSAMFRMRHWHLALGSFFGDVDAAEARRVAVVGRNISQSLAIGQGSTNVPISVNGTQYTVIGVLADTGKTFDGVDLPNAIFIPNSAAGPLIGTGGQRVQYALVRAAPGVGAQQIDYEMTSYVRGSRHLRVDEAVALRFSDMAGIEESARAISTAVRALLAAIGSISLIVGGIGIMNIMLVSVAERKREIGIRMSIGATRNLIRMQFLVESAALCCAGAIAGLTLSELLGALISLSGQFQVTIGFGDALLAVASSIAIGLIFGAWPASRAANLMPADCLRSE